MIRQDARRTAGAVVALSGALLLALGSPASAESRHQEMKQSAGFKMVQVMAHGVRVSLRVPDVVYPRDALVRVTASVQNTSAHAIGIMTPGTQQVNGISMPQIEVLDKHGIVVYPPALQGCCAWPSAPPYPQALQPGQIVHLDSYVILRGPHLRAVATVSDTPQLGPPQYRVATPPLQLKLGNSDAPHITLQEERANPPRPLAVTLTPSHAVRGSMQYMEWLDCSYFDVNVGVQRTGVVRWTTSSNDMATVQPDASGTQIVPHCPSIQQAPANKVLTGRLVQWHVVAGWPNHSVRVFDYAAGWINPSSIKPARATQFAQIVVRLRSPWMARR